MIKERSIQNTSNITDIVIQNQEIALTLQSTTEIAEKIISHDKVVKCDSKKSQFISTEVVSRENEAITYAEIKLDESKKNYTFLPTNNAQELSTTKLTKGLLHSSNYNKLHTHSQYNKHKKDILNDKAEKDADKRSNNLDTKDARQNNYNLLKSKKQGINKFSNSTNMYSGNINDTVIITPEKSLPLSANATKIDNVESSNDFTGDMITNED